MSDDYTSLGVRKGPAGKIRRAAEKTGLPTAQWLEGLAALLPDEAEAEEGTEAPGTTRTDHEALVGEAIEQEKADETTDSSRQ